MPTILFNKETQKLEPVPETEVDKLYATGQWAIPMVGPSGERKPVDPALASQYVSMGWKQPDPDKLEAYRVEKERQAAIQEKFGGVAGESQAGLQAFLRGASSGLSDPLQTILGGTSQAKRRLLQEANPGISTGFEVGGAVAPLAAALISGGVSAAAEGAGAAALKEAGASVAERSAVDAAAAEGLGSLASSEPASKIVSLAKRLATGSTIGAAANTGQLLSEADLGEVQLTGEKLRAAVTTGALVGLGTEGLFAIGERVIPKAVEKLGNALGSLKDKLNISKNAALAEGEVRTNARDLAKAIGDYTDGMKHATHEASTVGRPAEVADQLMNHDLAASKSGMEVALNRVEDRVNKAAASLGKDAYGMSNVRGFVDEARVRLADVETSAEVHDIGNELKDQIHPYSKAGRATTELERPAISSHTDSYNIIKQTLEDPETFGAAGSRTKEYNSAIHDEINARDVLLKRLGAKEELGTYRPYMKPNSGKIEQFLRNADQATMDGVHEAMAAMADKGEAALKQIEQTYKGTANMPDTGNLRDLATRVSDAQAKGIDSVQRLGESVPAGARLGGRGVGAIVGGALGRAASMATGVPYLGTVGAVLGGAVSGGARQLEVLSKLAGTLKTVNEKIGGGIASFLTNPGARAATESMTSRLLGEAQTEKIQSIDKLMSSPEYLAQALERTIGPKMQMVAPNVSMAMKADMVNSLNLLQQTAPRGRHSMGGGGMLKGRHGGTGVSRSVELKWSRQHRAVDNKLSIIDDLKAHKLHPDAVAAFATASPLLHQTIKDELAQQIADKPNLVLSHPQRVQLAILFQQPMDDSQSPGFKAMVQGNFGQAAQAGQASGAPQPQSRQALYKLQAPQDATESERLMTRRA